MSKPKYAVGDNINFEGGELFGWGTEHILDGTIIGIQHNLSEYVYQVKYNIQIRGGKGRGVIKEIPDLAHIKEQDLFKKSK